MDLSEDGGVVCQFDERKGGECNDGRYVASSVFCKIKGFRNTYSSLSVMYGDTEAQGSCTY